MVLVDSSASSILEALLALTADQLLSRCQTKSLDVDPARWATRQAGSPEEESFASSLTMDCQVPIENLHLSVETPEGQRGYIMTETKAGTV